MSMQPINQTPMVLTSKSAVKVAALKHALRELGWDNAIIPVKAASGINEQPIGDETLRGAKNRIQSAQRIVSGAAIYVSIENGIYPQETGGTRYFDRVIVVVQCGDTSYVAMSEGVEFPVECVEEARQRGFALVTVGQVMAERGVVEHHDDPHLTLAGKSRKEFLVETTRAALQQLIPALGISSR